MQYACTSAVRRLFDHSEAAGFVCVYTEPAAESAMASSLSTLADSPFMVRHLKLENRQNILDVQRKSIMPTMGLVRVFKLDFWFQEENASDSSFPSIVCGYCKARRRAY